MWPIENAVANVLDRSSRTFELLFSENKCSLLFQCLIDGTGDLIKNDLANDLE